MCYCKAAVAGEVLVDSEPQMAQHYFRGDFAGKRCFTHRSNGLLVTMPDLLGFLPADWLALGALAACSTLSGGAPCIGSTAGWEGGALEWLPLLRLLHLARLYRLRQLFSYLEYNLNVSLLQVTIARNLAIVLLATHLTACGFFLAGWHSGFSSEAMHGADSVFLAGLAPSDQYLYSLYWAVTTLSMVEANSVPASMPEIIRQAMGQHLMLWPIAVDSGISAGLKTNRIPPELRESMQEHLRLHFDTQDASDEQVLSIFPTTIRRRILQVGPSAAQHSAA
ncbi:hypothetical protein COHA_002836 [Chlorella ohadii]|uniref:Ion transport domain-containing protein n=1 Tax=Chlorella ohadii TaxID=2649997 RepID=A0AAD5DWA4_9CHLO|nr:hypothetical protein COHA_002836 [Chlorella ohadii]